MTVEVTAEDIAEGRPGRRDCCPIALALRRQYPTRDIRVGTAKAAIGVERFKLPPEARRFVTRFDYRRPVEPFTFTLESDTPRLKPGACS